MARLIEFDNNEENSTNESNTEESNTEESNGGESFVIFNSRYREIGRGIESKRNFVEGLNQNGIECWLVDNQLISIKIKDMIIRLESFVDDESSDLISKLMFVAIFNEPNPMEKILENCLINTNPGNEILCDFMLYHLFLNKIIGGKILIDHCEKLYLSFDNKLFFINSSGNDDNFGPFVIEYEIVPNEV